GDVILAIKASGMCGSDLHTYRAPANPGGVVTGGIKRAAGVIAGHEPGGVVAAAGHRHRAVQGVRGLACPFLGGRRATPARRTSSHSTLARAGGGFGQAAAIERRAGIGAIRRGLGGQQRTKAMTIADLSEPELGPPSARPAITRWQLVRRLLC